MRTIGRPEHAAINARLASRAEAVSPLIVAHRGTGLGSIPENTSGAAIAAVRQGADIVEIDTIRSTDGEYFVFHDGYERMHFDLRRSILELDAAELRELRYHWFSLGVGRRALTPLADLLRDCHDIVFNVDRSWRYWPDVFRVLDENADPGCIALKCPPEAQYLDALAAHDVPYPLIPRVTDAGQVSAVLDRDDLNVVGLELIAPDERSPFCDPAYLAELRSRGLLVFVNALSFGPELVQFAGWDDETSVLGDPDAGWGRLIALGADIVQTDWPDLLRDYRDGR